MQRQRAVHLLFPLKLLLTIPPRLPLFSFVIQNSFAGMLFSETLFCVGIDVVLCPDWVCIICRLGSEHCPSFAPYKARIQQDMDDEGLLCFCRRPSSKPTFHALSDLKLANVFLGARRLLEGLQPLFNSWHYLGGWMWTDGTTFHSV